MELPLNIIFETPTVADLAFYLIEQEALGADEDLLEALLDELEGNEEKAKELDTQTSSSSK